MECWARDVSPCNGPQSGEHYVSKGLLQTNRVRIRGLPFCGEEIREIAVSGLKSNILCSGHNSQLSPLDSEAKRFRESLFAASARSAAATPARVSGPRLSRWMAKTYCNFMMVGGEAMVPDFANFAFGESCSTSFHFYVWFPLARQAARLGLRTQLVEDHFQFNHFYDKMRVIVFVRFYGVRLIQTNFDAFKLAVLDGGQRLMVDTRDLLEKPSQFGLSRGQPDGSIVPSHEVLIDW